MLRELKLIDDKRRIVRTKAQEITGRLYLSFSYNEFLKDEIKAMDGAKWDPKTFRWHIPINERNMFQLDFLQGKEVYKNYDSPVKEFEPNRDLLMNHQKEMFNESMTRKRCLLACEMGTGKTLVAIEVMERALKDFGISEWWWVGPLSANVSVELEFLKWKTPIKVKIKTYNEISKLIKQDKAGDIDLQSVVPEGMICDESSKLKNLTSQRSQAVKKVVSLMKDNFNYGKSPDPFVILLSGTPAPQSPLDWYSQCEILCPGFIREGNIFKFKDRLSIVTKEQDSSGNFYPKLVTWLDDRLKCKKCGEFKQFHSTDHNFIESINEVELLYKRMSGLVKVVKKKDCMDLPDKTYRRIELDVSQTSKRILKTLKATSERVIDFLCKARQLSDGFQYVIDDISVNDCPNCNGTRKVVTKVYPEGTDLNMNMLKLADVEMVEAEIECFVCDGLGVVAKQGRVIKEVSTPKDDALLTLMDEYSEAGRMVVYAGFTASIDRCKQLILDAGWEVIVADGRGWDFSSLGCETRVEALKLFQEQNDRKIIFLGQPEAAGMGLTLTASSVVVFYSNSHKGEARLQAEDRIHRAGMDKNRGASIVDLLHLETDYAVLDCLKNKLRLQDMTLGQFIKEE